MQLYPREAEMLLLWLSLAGASEVPEPIDDSPPWGPSSTTYLSPNAMEGLQAYQRYQRIANTGLPLYIGGLSLTAYSIYALEMNVMDPANALVTGGIGVAVAWGGAGALGWGSYNAIIRLHEGQSVAPPVFAGTIAIGLLGISGAGYVMSMVFLPVLPISAAALGIGVVTGVLAGIPAIVQTSINPGKARRVAENGWAVLPFRQRDGYGLTVARRF